MKVFKMNDSDWVCASSEESAKEYYKKLIGCDSEDIEEFFEGEVSLANKMYVLASDVPEKEKPFPWHGELWVEKSFGWVIDRQKITEPCVICSTEY
ncbi:hypothetical protein ACUXCC_003455 [Cytobacillus horneckiae]|uniref:hypothetical protein n=1 Tax=Cytobacillus horneckiae TaxID=549687 RepID=UPI0019D17139|nr:hypothetical protein [Cytobacillus horneckiae]MBN6889920.1 hypothetical protein [Cytobacillus horneckiae]